MAIEDVENKAVRSLEETIVRKLVHLFAEVFLYESMAIYAKNSLSSLTDISDAQGHRSADRDAAWLIPLRSIAAGFIALPTHIRTGSRRCFMYPNTATTAATFIKQNA